jgi:hypothetical protein
LSSTWSANHHRASLAGEQAGQRHDRVSGRHSILSADQLADYGPWFDSHRRLRELVAELEELSLTIAEADPRWNR